VVGVGVGGAHLSCATNAWLMVMRESELRKFDEENYTNSVYQKSLSPLDSSLADSMTSYYLYYLRFHRIDRYAYTEDTAPALTRRYVYTVLRTTEFKRPCVVSIQNDSIMCAPDRGDIVFFVRRSRCLRRLQNVEQTMWRLETECAVVAL